jgi:NAD(P)-dependent dehydrogenase (short-subunit alcohol dehydrogenase family)
MTQLKGLVTIITGAASGLGEATARRFVADGATVILSDIQVDRGAAVANGLRAAFAAADVTIEEEVAALVAQAVDRYGRLDCMINNAGLLGFVGSITAISEADWSNTIAVLLGSVFYGMKHAARVMIEQRSGVILSTASIAGLVPLGPHIYTTAKHGLVGLTRSVGSELAAHGIRVNAVAPGKVPTQITGNRLGGYDAVRRDAAARNPLGRTVEADEIAGAFAYLAGPDGRSITGQILTADAGLTACPGIAVAARTTLLKMACSGGRLSLIKVMGLVAPRPGLSRQAFHDHWRHPHGTYVMHNQWARQYVQCHCIESKWVGSNDFGFVGVAELTFDSIEGSRHFATHPVYLQYNLPDEDLFLDHDRMELLCVTEEVIQGGRYGANVPMADASWSDNNRPFGIKPLRNCVIVRGLPSCCLHKASVWCSAPDSKAQGYRCRYGGHTAWQ